MLEQLFGSCSRVKILNLFLLNPEEKFYIRELSRKLKLQLNSVRRELENLEKFGILISSISTGEKGENKLIFSVADKKSKSAFIPLSGTVAGRPAFAKAMAGRPSFAKATAGKQEKKYYQVNPDFILFEEIKFLIMKAQILYERNFINKLEKIGKAKLLILTGIFVNNSDSPIDLLLVGRFSKTKLAKLISELENELSKEINYTLMGSKEFKYRKDITDIFLYGILEGKKIVAIDKTG